MKITNQWYIEVEYLRPNHIYNYVTKVFHVYDVTLSYAVEVCWCLRSYNLFINRIILTEHSVFSNMIFSFNYISYSSWYDICRTSWPIPVAHVHVHVPVYRKWLPLLWNMLCLLWMLWMTLWIILHFVDHFTKKRGLNPYN
jgi:hypothetical protein